MPHPQHPTAQLRVRVRVYRNPSDVWTDSRLAARPQMLLRGQDPLATWVGNSLYAFPRQPSMLEPAAMPASHWSLYKQTSVSLYEDNDWVGRLHTVVHFNFEHWTSNTLVGVCNAEWLDLREPCRF